MLHEELSKYIVSDLSRPFTIDSYQSYNEEKLFKTLIIWQLPDESKLYNTPKAIN